MNQKDEALEKYSIGFNRSKPDKPYLLIGEGFGKEFKLVNAVTDKDLVVALYKALTNKPWTL